MSQLSTQTTKLLTAATATGAGTAVHGIADSKNYTAWGTTSTGTGSATINVEGSNNVGVTWEVIGTITLTLGASVTGDGFASADRYGQVRGNITAISGTGASVNLAMGF